MVAATGTTLATGTSLEAKSSEEPIENFLSFFGKWDHPEDFVRERETRRQFFSNQEEVSMALPRSADVEATGVRCGTHISTNKAMQE